MQAILTRPQTLFKITLALLLTIWLLLVITVVQGCANVPKTEEEKKATATAITETTKAIGAVTPFPWDGIVYAVGGIAMALAGVGGYKSLKKPKETKTTVSSSTTHSTP